MEENFMNIKTAIKKLIPKKVLENREKLFLKETYINQAIRRIQGKTYIEIGVKNGRCFRQIVAPKKSGWTPALYQVRTC